LHWNEKVSTNWRTNLAFHYTKGKGYYENYKENGKFSDYGLTQLLVTALQSTDLVRQNG
jgi:iron complex outermembrane receptor protein